MKCVSSVRNAVAAANDLGVFKWFCRLRGISVPWDAEKLKLPFNGLKKYILAQMAGKLQHELALMNDPLMSCVAKHAKG